MLQEPLQLIEIVENDRELAANILDLYQSALANRMNEIMKVLTIIATIFIPLTFIAGVYGMNFENMPELHTRNGYFVVLGMMAILGFGMFAWFIRKGWLSRSRKK
ncbi:MAG: hypothetical protein HC890_15660 [Chloroflexaceae bacterium]|nr:hypothetical protein [Chloroflexaceae bacterium]